MSHLKSPRIFLLAAVVLSSLALSPLLCFARDAKPVIEALEAVAESLKTVEADIEAKRTLLKNKALSETERAQIEVDVKTLTDRQEELNSDFTAIATGVENIERKSETEEDLDIGQELKDLLRPMVRELKDATRQPREIEDLRRQLSEAESRFSRLKQASEHIDQLFEAEPDDAVKTRLKEEQKRWADRLQQAEGRIKTLNVQLDDNLSQKRSIIESLSDGVRNFLKSRGFSLLLMVGAFLVVFLTMRFLHTRFRKFSPWHKRTFYVRLIDVTYQFATVFGAIASALIVLYAMGDWVLLVLMIIILIGIVLAAKHGLPHYYQQARILLNVGEVREGERIILDGLPWKIERLSFYSRLENPVLQGGVLRIPVAMLIGKTSRPFDENEQWFPSKKGDWVRLSDETIGKVMVQSPESVQLLRLGGSRKLYTVSDYLAMTPENLSGHFRLRTVFGVDYSHQKISTTEIPEKLQPAVFAALMKVVEREHIQNVKVEVSAAGASSIDYDIIADFHGEVASKYDQLRRLLQKACIDASNANGWIIPFTQVTIHQAK